jgi:bifunctional non-homologous end joining protein LigD
MITALASARESCRQPGPSALMSGPAFLDLSPRRAEWAAAPSGPDWAHEIKHDGYRLIVRRDGLAVRLFTRL